MTQKAETRGWCSHQKDAGTGAPHTPAGRWEGGDVHSDQQRERVLRDRTMHSAAGLG